METSRGEQTTSDGALKGEQEFTTHCSVCVSCGGLGCKGEEGEQETQSGWAQAAFSVRGAPSRAGVRHTRTGQGSQCRSGWSLGEGGWKANLGLSLKGSAGQAKELGLYPKAMQSLQKHLWKDQP